MTSALDAAEDQLKPDRDGAYAQLKELGALNIDLQAITQKLQPYGVAAFTQSFETLLSTISVKRDKLLAG